MKYFFIELIKLIVRKEVANRNRDKKETRILGCCWFGILAITLNMYNFFA